MVTTFQKSMLPSNQGEHMYITTLHGVIITQKTSNCNITAVKASKLASF